MAEAIDGGGACRNHRKQDRTDKRYEVLEASTNYEYFWALENATEDNVREAIKQACE